MIATGAWEKVRANEWRTVVAGKTCTVRRERFQRSWSVPRKFGFGPSVRQYTSCTYVYAVVTIGNEFHHLKRQDGIYTVRDAKLAAIRYAESGQGQADITTVEG